jgi:DNA-binding transcriptional LysR family regulator
MDLASQMLLFARVAERGSFSAAARAIDQTPSAVSRQIATLEDRLGVRLLHRTQSGVSLTEEGRAFRDRCADLAVRVAEAQEAMAALGGRAQGALRVASTVAFGRQHLVPAIPAFLAAHPDIRLSLSLTDAPVDLSAEDAEIDVAIQFTEQVDQPLAMARKIAPNRRVICAAPGYLDAVGAPERPEDLARLNCLRLSTVASWNDWSLRAADGAPIRLGGNFEADSADAVYAATLAGMGVARLSAYMVAGDLAAGRLVRVLPGYEQHGSDIVALYADRRNLAPRIRAFLDHLVASFSPPPWER